MAWDVGLDECGRETRPGKELEAGSPPLAALSPPWRGCAEQAPSGRSAGRSGTPPSRHR